MKITNVPVFNTFSMHFNGQGLGGVSAVNLGTPDLNGRYELMQVIFAWWTYDYYNGLNRNSGIETITNFSINNGQVWFEGSTDYFKVFDECKFKANLTLVYKDNGITKYISRTLQTGDAPYQKDPISTAPGIWAATLFLDNYTHQVSIGTNTTLPMEGLIAEVALADGTIIGQAEDWEDHIDGDPVNLNPVVNTNILCSGNPTSIKVRVKGTNRRYGDGPWSAWRTVPVPSYLKAKSFSLNKMVMGNETLLIAFTSLEGVQVTNVKFKMTVRQNAGDQNPIVVELTNQQKTGASNIYHPIPTSYVAEGTALLEVSSNETGCTQNYFYYLNNV